MEESRAEDVSSSLATMEDIRKRLVRPPSLHSQPSSSSIASHWFIRKISQNSPKFDVNLNEQQIRNRDVKGIKRLEDYLDPFLLSTIRARICGKKKTYCGYGAGIKNAAKSEGSDFDRFERSGDHHELYSSTEGSRGTEASRAKPEERNDVVDLKIDCDSFGLGVAEDEQRYCTPFQQFERNALKRFKH